MSVSNDLYFGVFLFILVLFIVPAMIRLRFPRVFRPVVSALVAKPALVASMAFVLSLGLSALLTRCTGVPPPSIHDEFSYLLAADTFAHGRLTNSPSPYPNFDTFHVLQRPTYQSKYPPGHGLFLAVGERIAGVPIVGAWIEIALAAAALSWMYFAWFPRRWALLGSLFTCLHPGMLMWSHCYWGGGGALLGAALLFGGIRRCADRPSSTSAGLASLGVGLWPTTFQFVMFVPAIWAFVALRRDRWALLALIGSCVGAVALLCETWFNTHYAAPFAPLGAILVLVGLRHLNTWRIERRAAGRSMVVLISVIYVISFFVCFRQIVHTEFPPWAVRRADIASTLEGRARRCLVLVRYAPRHNWQTEWVYNGADLENDHVVWARSVGEVQDRQLLAHYAGRELWVCEPDRDPIVVKPF